MIFYLAEAPSKEATKAVYQEAHGLTADEITEVKQGSWQHFRLARWAKATMHADS